MTSKMDWVKGWVRKWQECRFCHRNLYAGERVFKLVGTPSNYIICKECAGKFNLREEEVRIRWEKQREEELTIKGSSKRWTVRMRLGDDYIQRR
jgi:hypothetical protein